MSPLRVIQRIAAGNRISRPSRCYGKKGFLRFLRENLPEAENHENIYQSVRQAALVSIQNFRNEHLEFGVVEWGRIGYDHKLELAEYTLKIALQERNESNIIRQCPDFRPCLVVLQTK